MDEKVRAQMLQAHDELRPLMRSLVAFSIYLRFGGCTLIQSNDMDTKESYRLDLSSPPALDLPAISTWVPAGMGTEEFALRKIEDSYNLADVFLDQLRKDIASAE